MKDKSGTCLKQAGGGTALADSSGTKVITFRVVRRMAKRTPNHVALWRGYLDRDEGPKIYVFLRLGEANKVVQDYLLVPSPEKFRPYLTLSDSALSRLRAARVRTVNELIAEIAAQF